VSDFFQTYDGCAVTKVHWAMDAAQLRLYSGHLNSLSDIPTEQSNQIKVFLSCNLPGEGEYHLLMGCHSNCPNS